MLVLALGLAGVVSSFGGYWPELRRIAVSVEPVALIGGWLLMSSGLVALSMRWRAFFPADVRAPVVPLAAILLVGMLLNYALPGPAGELVGAGMAGRRFGFPAERALAAGIAARFVGLGLAGLVALGLVQTGLVTLPASLDAWVRMASVAIGGLAIGLVGLAASPGITRRLAAHTTGRFARLERVHAAILRMTDALAAMAHVGWGAWVRGAGWALVGHGLVVAGVAVAARSIGAFPALAGLAFTYAASTAGAIVLFAFPGGQVGWDGLFASLLASTAGLSVPAALAVTLLVRVQQLGLVVAGALVLIRSVRDGTRPPAG
jgi:hypothetical protein